MAKKISRQTNDHHAPVKAYNNPDFMNSSDARTIRVLCEFTEPGTRFRKKHIKDTIVFFGSARFLPFEDAEKRLAEARQAIKGKKRPSGKDRAAVDRAQWGLEGSRYYEDARDLARRMTQWSKSLKGTKRRFIVCSGGGPGIMEAANRGASDAGGLSMGLNISLPHEQYANPYITDGLGFEFHYFFIRKFWFFYLAKALVVFPGGFGTFDELFELLTIVQTSKTTKYMPIVLYGKEFWNDVVNFDAMLKWGVIDEDDMKLFKLVDSVDEAFAHLKGELTRLYL